MLLIYLLIFLTPVAIVFLVFVAIGMAGLHVYRSGRRAMMDFKPYIDGLKAGAADIQRKSTDLAGRGQMLSETFEEIGGRWAFITQSFQETTSSPVIKLAGMAGRFAGGRGD